MDPLTILFAYISTWVNSLNYTLGAAVIALAFLYFTRTLPVGQRIAIPAIVGVFVSVLGTGVLFPASALPQLGYPLCLFALGSGCAIGYLAVTTFTKRNLGWVLIIVASHLAAYCVMLSAGFVCSAGRWIRLRVLPCGDALLYSLFRSVHRSCPVLESCMDTVVDIRG